MRLSDLRNLVPVVHCNDGEFVFEWWNGPRKLTLFASRLGLEYVQVCGMAEDEMIYGWIMSVRQAVRLFRWLAGGRDAQP